MSNGVTEEKVMRNIRRRAKLVHYSSEADHKYSKTVKYDYKVINNLFSMWIYSKV